MLCKFLFSGAVAGFLEMGLLASLNGDDPGSDSLIFLDPDALGGFTEGIHEVDLLQGPLKALDGRAFCPSFCIFSSFDFL